MGKVLGEAANDVKHEDEDGDHVAKGGEIIHHLLETAIVGDGEVASNEVAKLRLKLHGGASRLLRN